MRRDSLKAPRVYTIPPVQVDCLQSAFYSHRTIFFESGLLFEGIRPLLSSFSGQRPISAFLGYSELSPRTGVRSRLSAAQKPTGHSLEVSAAIEGIICALALQHGFVPPTLNYQEPDPACDLDAVPNQPREKRLQYILSNAFGFGGINSCVVYKRI